MPLCDYLGTLARQYVSPVDCVVETQVVVVEEKHTASKDL